MHASQTQGSSTHGLRASCIRLSRFILLATAGKDKSTYLFAILHAAFSGHAQPFPNDHRQRLRQSGALDQNSRSMLSLDPLEHRSGSGLALVAKAMTRARASSRLGHAPAKSSTAAWPLGCCYGWLLAQTTRESSIRLHLGGHLLVLVLVVLPSAKGQHLTKTFESRSCIPRGAYACSLQQSPARLHAHCSNQQ